MDKQDKIAQINDIVKMLSPLFESIDEAYTSTMDFLSVNLLEKYYIETSAEDIQDIHNQWAEDTSELRHVLKDLSKKIKHIDFLPEDSFVTKIIRDNIKWNVSQVWEVITENFSHVTSDLIEVGEEKYDITFKEINPLDFLERIEIINDDELESHVFRTFNETNAKKGNEDHAIHLVTDWWVETPENPYFLSEQSDDENKISPAKLDSILKGFKADKDFIQLDIYSFTYTIKLAVAADIARLVSIYLNEYWNEETVVLFANALKSNDDVWAALNSEIWEEYLSIITRNLEPADLKGPVPAGTWTKISKNNEFFGNVMKEWGIGKNND